MATLVLTPAVTHIGRPVVVTGAAWSTDPVVVSVISPHEDATLTFTLTPSTGAITSVGAFTFAPGCEGLYTFRADDGTTVVSKTLSVNKGGA
jgi:hypothetical protein